eukprot:1696934-Rhodomonas_salina.2
MSVPRYTVPVHHTGTPYAMSVPRYTMPVHHHQYHDTLCQYIITSTTIRYVSTSSVPRYAMSVHHHQYHDTLCQCIIISTTYAMSVHHARGIGPLGRSDPRR